MNLKKSTIFPALLCLATLLPGCGSDSGKTTHRHPAPDSVRVTISPMYRLIKSYPSLSPLRRAERLDSLRPGLQALSVLFDEDLTVDETLDDFARRPVTTMFTPAVNDVFRPELIDSVEIATGIAIDNLKHELPGTPIPRIYGIVSPYQRRVYMVDSVMLVALNHYLGKNFEGYEGMPEYLRVMKTPRQMPYDIVEAIVAINNPYRPGDKGNTLARMLINGAYLLTKMRTVENARLEDALRITPEQLRWLEDNEKNVWNKMVTDQIIFSTDPAIGDRLVLPAPSTPMIHPDAPGRVGTFIGYRILLSYLDRHPSTPLSTLLSPSFYTSADVLRESGYKGGK